MEQIGNVNGRKVLYHNLRMSAMALNEAEPGQWIAFFITGAEDPYYPNAMSVCKRMKTPYIVCSGEEADACADLYETEAFMGFEPNREAFEEPPVVHAKIGIAEGFNFSLFFAQPEEGECNWVVCIDTTERGVKRYLTRMAAEWAETEDYDPPAAGEEKVEWDN